jgi:hypothetical protein
MYKLPVKIDGIERRKRSTGLLHIVAGFFLIVNAGTYNQKMNFDNISIVLPFYGVAAISLLYGFFRKRFDPMANYNHWVRLLQFLSFAMLTLLFIDFSGGPQIIGLALWAAVTLFLMFTERKVFHDAYLQIKGDGIHVPGYLKVNVVPWAIIESLVVRSDYVTILRRDQKYVQLEVSHDLCIQDLEQLHQFSKQHIDKYAPQQVQS